MRDLAEGINIEELVTAGEQNVEQGDEDDEANEEGWIDEWVAMNEAEREELDVSV